MEISFFFVKLHLLPAVELREDKNKEQNVHIIYGEDDGEQLLVSREDVIMEHWVGVLTWCT